MQDLEHRKVSAANMFEMEGKMKELDSKVKHITVYATELAKLLLPEKQGSRFATQHDLNQSIKRREDVIRQGKCLTNWIMR